MRWFRHRCFAEACRRRWLKIGMLPDIACVFCGALAPLTREGERGEADV